MSIRIPLGVNQYIFEKNRERSEIVLDLAKAANPHLMMMGGSGAGKTHRLRKLIESAVIATGGKVRFHVFDRHGDIRCKYESSLLFSQSTEYGFNPLEVNPDPHFGGPRKQINKFIIGVERMSKQLGSRQLPLLRMLLEDLYLSHGYDLNDPSTWIPDDPHTVRAKLLGKEHQQFVDVQFHQKEAFKEMMKTAGARGTFDREIGCWWIHKDDYKGDLLLWPAKNPFKTSPTLSDAVEFSRRMLESAYLGVNSAAANRLNDFNRLVAAFHRRCEENAKQGRTTNDGQEAVSEKILEAKGKAIEAVKAYLDSVQTGRELDEVLKCRSFDVMQAVHERLLGIKAMGFLRDNPPPFDPNAPVWRYRLPALAGDEQQLFVHYVMNQIYDRAMQRGETDHVVEVVVLDEAEIFFSDDDDNIVDKFAREIRKFGVGLWVSSQGPKDFSEAFITNVATKIVMALDDNFAQYAVSKLNIKRDTLKYVVPRKNALVQMKISGEVQGGFIRTLFES